MQIENKLWMTRSTHCFFVAFSSSLQIYMKEGTVLREKQLGALLISSCYSRGQKFRVPNVLTPILNIASFVFRFIDSVRFCCTVLYWFSLFVAIWMEPSEPCLGSLRGFADWSSKSHRHRECQMSGSKSWELHCFAKLDMVNINEGRYVG